MKSTPASGTPASLAARIRNLKPLPGFRWRPIVLDGLNLLHGGNVHSKNYNGLEKLLRFILFLQQVLRIVLTDQWLEGFLEDPVRTTNTEIMRWLIRRGYIIAAPRLHPESEKSNDDLCVCETAEKLNGLIVSNDKYRDAKLYQGANSRRAFIYRLRNQLTFSETHQGFFELKYLHQPRPLEDFWETVDDPIGGTVDGTIGGSEELRADGQTPDDESDSAPLPSSGGDVTTSRPKKNLSQQK